MLVAVIMNIVSCKKTVYNPDAIESKWSDSISATSFEIPFKVTESDVKTIHVKLNTNGYDVLFDTGCSTVLISSHEIEDMLKQHTLTLSDFIDEVSVATIADGSTLINHVVNIHTITVVDNKGEEHVLRDVKATVVDKPTADILIGTSVIDRLCKKSYTVDLERKIIIFQ